MITCIALTSKTKIPNQNGNLLGKRRLFECEQIMIEVEKGLWVCPLGHKRYSQENIKGSLNVGVLTG